jgi:predicted esterase
VLLPLVLLSSGSPAVADEPKIEQSTPVLHELEGEFLQDIAWQDLSLLGNAARRAVSRVRSSPDGASPDHRRLFAAGERAYSEEDWNPAYRYVIRSLLVARGDTVTEGTELASSLDLSLHLDLDPRRPELRISLEPSFTLGRQLVESYVARLSLVSGDDDVVEPLASVSIQRLTTVSIGLPVEDLAPGRYGIRYRLESSDGRPLVETVQPWILPTRDARLRVAALADALEAASDDRQDVRRRTAMDTIRWVVEAFQGGLTTHAEVATIRPMTAAFVGRSRNQAPDPRSVERDLRLAESLAQSLLAGEDPISGRIGHLRFAYRSDFDGTLQPFRVFVPQGLDPARPSPMVVALHGAGGDENIYMERYLVPLTYLEDVDAALAEVRHDLEASGGGPPPVRPGYEALNLFTWLSQERGSILVTPRGRGPMSGYRGPGESDVLDVINLMVRLYAVRKDQIFLTGHSMGGGGTWWIGLRNPGLFAALAPVAGGGHVIAELEPQLTASARSLPVLFVQGGRDETVPPERSRGGAELAQTILENFTYREYPLEDHFTIGVATLETIFDFFDSFRREPSERSPQPE